MHLLNEDPPPPEELGCKTGDQTANKAQWNANTHKNFNKRSLHLTFQLHSKNSWGITAGIFHPPRDEEIKKHRNQLSNKKWQKKNQLPASSVSRIDDVLQWSSTLQKKYNLLLLQHLAASQFAPHLPRKVADVEFWTTPIDSPQWGPLSFEMKYKHTHTHLTGRRLNYNLPPGETHWYTPVNYCH